MSVLTSPLGTSPRPPRAVRRRGYVVGVLVNTVMLLLVNAWPGWQVVPFLTAGTTEVLPLVNASMAAGVVASAVYVAADPPRLRALGDVVVTAVGLAALAALWRVFPLDFSGQGFDWAPLARVLLVLGIVGSAVAIVVHLVTLVVGPVHRP